MRFVLVRMRVSWGMWEVGYVLVFLFWKWIRVFFVEVEDYLVGL